MALARIALFAAILATAPARAQNARDFAAPTPNTWIFAGSLPATGENFSGTLASDSTRSPAATAGGLRARFVSEGDTDLRVFASIDEEEFIVDAHLLDFDAPLDGVNRKTWPPALPPVPSRPVASP